MAREEIKDRIFDLETQLEGNAEQIRNIVRNIVRRESFFYMVEDGNHLNNEHQFRNSDKEMRLPKELTDSLAEKPLEVRRIVMLEDNLERDAVMLKADIKSQTTRSEKKTMSEELEELWEEVVEEILDTVNPEEDD